MLSAVKCFDRVCATEMTTEEKFRAAVNVIRNLPKNAVDQGEWPNLHASCFVLKE
ncbi:hypothetical protein L798_14553 [Zootermopsis nevadensis]|uniref:Uncharacterized protein n=1 Tax=Zootermopsis nevadensis TaxID=136037 RepID=A0A067QPV2_ZOONE|nr:hypothetical protein L798_14553 [Zootermopsis nevadensis]